MQDWQMKFFKSLKPHRSYIQLFMNFNKKSLTVGPKMKKKKMVNNNTEQRR